MRSGLGILLEKRWRSDVLEQASPLPACLSHTLARALRQRACGDALEEAKVDAHSFCNVSFSIELRVAGLTPQPGQLSACTHEPAQQDSDGEEIIALICSWLPGTLFQPDHQRPHRDHSSHNGDNLWWQMA